MTRLVLRLSSISLLTVALAAGHAMAQSLADVARTTNTGRTPASKPAKVYTNDNLRPDITPSTTPAAPGAGAATSDATQATPVPAPAAEPASTSDAGTRDEKYWKDRMRAANEALDRNEAFAAALQSQINGLTAEFVNRDDPAQRAAIEQRRTKAVADLEKVQRDLATSKKDIAAVEEEARKAGVPAGWLR
jgi:hypothetical protein